MTRQAIFQDFIGPTIVSAWLNPVDSMVFGLNGLDTTGATDSTALVQAEHDRVLALGGGSVYLPPGILMLGDLQIHSNVNLIGSGRGWTIIVALPTAQYAVIISVPRINGYAGLAEPSSMNGKIQDLTIIANMFTNPINSIDGILAANADPSKSPFGDPGYVGDSSKPYSAPQVYNVEISHATNYGIEIQPNRHRFYCEALGCLSNGNDGIHVGGTDSVIGPRSNSGSNAGHGVHYISTAGGIIQGLNAWSNPSQRSDQCLAVRLDNVNGMTITGSVFNDTIWINGSSGGATNEDRGISIVGCDFHPLDNLFTANGVPQGTASNLGNCFIRVTDTDQIVIASNDYNQTNQIKDGVQGWTFDYIVKSDGTGGVMFDGVATTETTVRPWANADNNCWHETGAAIIVAHACDPSIRVHRWSGCHVINADGGKASDTTVGFWVQKTGDAGNVYNRFDTDVVFNGNIAVDDPLKIIVNANSQVIGHIAGGNTVANLAGSGTFTGVTMGMPSNPRPGQVQIIKCGVGLTLTGFVLSGSSADVLDVALTSLASGVAYMYIYFSTLGANGTWIRIF